MSTTEQRRAQRERPRMLAAGIAAVLNAAGPGGVRKAEAAAIVAVIRALPGEHGLVGGLRDGWRRVWDVYRTRNLATQYATLNGAPRPGSGHRGYSRATITVLRPSGQMTLWWHAKTRRYRITRGTGTRRATTPGKLLMIDALAEVLPYVSRCASGACRAFFAVTDQRMRFCSTTCAARERQRRHRPGSATARAAFDTHEAKKAARRLARGYAPLDPEAVPMVKVPASRQWGTPAVPWGRLPR